MRRTTIYFFCLLAICFFLSTCQDGNDFGEGFKAALEQTATQENSDSGGDNTNNQETTTNDLNYDQLHPTDEALTTFAANFPSDVTPPTWAQLETLWNIWRATAEGGKIDLFAYIETTELDDDTGYRLNHIPQEFYTWMATREVVIDAVDGLEFIDSTLVAADTILNVAEQWGIPRGKYVRFTPKGAINPEVTYSSSELVPGIHYRVELNFAPETLIENTDSTSRYFLPTKVRVTARTGYTDNILISTTVVPATEATMLQYEDYVVKAMDFKLLYTTRVVNAELYSGGYSRIMRIAQMRMTPINE